MTIYLGADHRGFALKERIKKVLIDEGRSVEDLGAASLIPDDDYPTYSRAVAEKVSADPSGSRGIVICGSGVGVDVAANRFSGIRAALAISPEQIHQVRNDDDVNVLALAADFMDDDDAVRTVLVFLDTSFDASTPRYSRRLKEIDEAE